MRCIIVLLVCSATFVVISGDDNGDERSLLDRIQEQTKNVRNGFSADEDDREENDEDDQRDKSASVYNFLYKRLKQDANGKPKKKRLTPNVYMIPGQSTSFQLRIEIGYERK
ncbi:unnamed protein product [Heligmosomoides polygyrus]|uniref:Cystatin domain-containing protein n=1 Tax=Heligmosomoides polygyrus TaxID=6339 RepID=A0A183GKJ6_HELPZ|nr:unnamed protein product [Heligmosomoides polygyrus]